RTSRGTQRKQVKVMTLGVSKEVASPWSRRVAVGVWHRWQVQGCSRMDVVVRGGRTMRDVRGAEGTGAVVLAEALVVLPLLDRLVGAGAVVVKGTGGGRLLLVVFTGGGVPPV